MYLGPSSYKNFIMYPSWQWPPTPEGLPQFRLPPIHTRYACTITSRAVFLMLF